MRKKWENIVVSVQYSEDFVNTIESVTFRVTYNGGEGRANVTISNNHDLPWNEVISCKCNWVLMTGRPCIHASFCLRFPHLDNKLPRDKFFEDFGTDRRWYYNRNYHVDRMIQQYTATFHFPEYESLTAEQLYPWQFMPAAGLKFAETSLKIT